MLLLQGVSLQIPRVSPLLYHDLLFLSGNVPNWYEPPLLLFSHEHEATQQSATEADRASHAETEQRAR